MAGGEHIESVPRVVGRWRSAERRAGRTLAGEELKRRDDTEQLVLYGGDVRCVMRAQRWRVCVPVRGVLCAARHEVLEDLQEVLEEVDVHQVRELGDAAQRRR